MKLRLLILFAFVCALVLTAAGLGNGRAAEARPAITAESTHRATSQPAPQALPDDSLMFIQNVGQFAEEARFQVRGGDRTIWLAEDAIWITLLEPAAAGALSDRRGGFPLAHEREEANRRGVNIRLSFVGANPAPLVQASEPLTTTISYFLGNDPAQWRPDVPVWGGVRYADLYPGLDLELVGQGGILAPRLVCHATDCAAALANVQLAVAGAEALAVEQGHLQLHTAVGNWQLPLLAVVDVSGRPVEGGMPDVAVVGNVVQHPYMSRPLSAQPPTASPRQAAGSELLYATFLGGSVIESGSGIAVDNTGSAYVTGYTASPEFPTTPGAFDTSKNGARDIFIVRLNPAGSNLIYATFLGGTGVDYGDSATDIALDSGGNAYITGYTDSADFPTTPGAFDTTFNGDVDAFAARLSSTGSNLLYATFLGGTGYEAGLDITLDSNGSAYITGDTWSSNFPTTPGAFDTIFNGVYQDAFVARLNPAGSDLIYATFLGGTGGEAGSGIALDNSGSAYVTGYTDSADFPATPGAFDTTFNGGYEAVFVAKLNPAGSALNYATFLGGLADEWGYGIAVDNTGSAYVTGKTDSTDFPTKPGAFDTTYNGGNFDAFVARPGLSGGERCPGRRYGNRSRCH